MNDDEIRGLLRAAKTIALVGASNRPDRDSHEVMKFLQTRGYRVIPINPTIADEIVLGEKVLGGLGEVTERVDMVDVFRRSDAVEPIVEDAIAIGAKAVWMQLGVINESAAAKARAAGLKVVMNRCPKLEIQRLGLLTTAA